MVSLKECVVDLLRIFYNRKFPLSKDDPGLEHGAYSVRSYYRGYPHVVRWETDKTWKKANLDAATFWCKENCKGKFTIHIHRVRFDHDYDGWVFDEMGGTDYCFFAFEFGEDAVMFSLVW